MTDSDIGKGGRPIQLVEQLQIRLVLEHEALHVGEHSHGGEDAGPGGGHLNNVPEGIAL